MSKSRQAALDRMRHMVSAADAIESYVRRGRAAFDNDSAVREAIVYQIVVLGEAAKAVVTADASIEKDLPWSTAERDVPKIRALLTAALRQLA